MNLLNNGEKTPNTFYKMTDTHEQWRELATKHKMSVPEYIGTLEWHERNRIAKKLSKQRVCQKK